MFYDLIQDGRTGHERARRYLSNMQDTLPHQFRALRQRDLLGGTSQAAPRAESNVVRVRRTDAHAQSPRLEATYLDITKSKAPKFLL